MLNIIEEEESSATDEVPISPSLHWPSWPRWRGCQQRDRECAGPGQQGQPHNEGCRQQLSAAVAPVGLTGADLFRIQVRPARAVGREGLRGAPLGPRVRRPVCCGRWRPRMGRRRRPSALDRPAAGTHVSTRRLNTRPAHGCRRAWRWPGERRPGSGRAVAPAQAARPDAPLLQPGRG